MEIKKVGATTSEITNKARKYPTTEWILVGRMPYSDWDQQFDIIYRYIGSCTQFEQSYQCNWPILS